MPASSQQHGNEFDGRPARYERAADLEGALRRLAEGGWTPLAGGTDFYPARVGRAVSESLLDLSGLHALRGVEATGDGGAPAWRIGALTTWSDLARAPLDASLAALQQAAREVGGVQIQNQATVGGNLCNASPAADGVPALLALDAQVELASVRGVRRLPVSGFVLGNRRTAMGPDELLTAVIVPRRSPRAVSRFLKLGHRRYLVISIVMAAVAVDFDDDARVSHCGVAVGACSSAALRLPAVERALLSAQRTQLAERFAALDHEAAFAPLAPIDDVRGTAAYRRHAAVELIRRIVAEVAEVADGAGGGR
ncbi:MAG TPA: FAD binding domain-containing protein [Zeimonas sp.]|nr:FAD binding domain-containing protein [Zeimonas sp.]